MRSAGVSWVITMWRAEPDLVVEGDAVGGVNVSRQRRFEGVRGGGASPLAVSRAESIETEPAHDDREPSAHVIDLVEVLFDEPNEGLLHNVLRLADAAKHPKRDVQQVAVVVTPGATQSSVELELARIAHAVPPGSPGSRRRRLVPPTRGIW